VNWSELPDLAAVILLACVFASISRRRPTRISRIWLVGWLMIVAALRRISVHENARDLGNIGCGRGVDCLGMGRNAVHVGLSS
jgi:hypothetical protein